MACKSTNWLTVLLSKTLNVSIRQQYHAINTLGAESMLGKWCAGLLLGKICGLCIPK